MLLDHFQPPLADHRNWKGFHNEWATYLSADLNRRLPAEWFATTEVDFGVEIDVAAMEETLSAQRLASSGSTSSDVGFWQPAPPLLTLTLPVVSDVVEVQVYRSSGGKTLVGAIELLSPRNKDRPEARQAFIAKCEALLGGGIGLIVVDVVTERRANLHRGLLERLGHDTEIGTSDHDDDLYVAAYHPVQREQIASVDVWHEPLVIGGEFPAMPLFLRGGPCVRVDLSGTYRRTCDEQRIPSN